MSRATELYELWSSDPFFDDKTRAELQKIKGDEAEIEDRFYQYLAFGTAGLRGVLGAGTNRMNVYTVALATEGFSRYIESLGGDAKKRGVVICYDCRHFSPEFAETAALVFARHGIHVRLMDELRPTPVLSFAVRHYNCAGGVMVTASHNPAKYNGYKAYGEDGGQMPPEAADLVLSEMNSISDIRTVKLMDRSEAEKKGLLEIVGPDIDKAYMEMLHGLSINKDIVHANEDMKIVFTPLHGTGNKPVRRILREIGFKNVIVVPEQELPDGAFPTVAFPNPEERSALEMAIALAEKENAELVIATDPDGDRTGLAIRLENGEYQVLTGNQIGILLMNYILSAKKKKAVLPESAFVVTTIVSTKLPRRIAEHYGVKLFECLTGFKWIAELIKIHDENGDMKFQFGFEESFGYLSGTSVRDKDAVVTSMLIAEMAATARSEGRTLNDMLRELYDRFGYEAGKTYSLVREGKSGLEAIKNAMRVLREKKLEIFSDAGVKVVKDIKTDERIDLLSGETGKTGLPESNVLLFELDGINWFAVRPSGTEPKIKVYFGTYAENQEKADAELKALTEKVLSKVEDILG